MRKLTGTLTLRADSNTGELVLDSNKATGVLQLRANKITGTLVTPVLAVPVHGGDFSSDFGSDFST